MAIPSSDDVELEVHDLGGEGQAVLCCHATGFHGLVWRPLARRLTGAHVWAVDLRGHGDSSPPTSGSYDWEGFADDVLATVDHLGLSGAVGVGHSKGGAALLLAEARRPGTFAALWVYEPVVFPAPLWDGEPSENPLAAGARARRSTFESHAAAEANYATKPPMQAFHPEARAAYVEHAFAPTPEGTVELKLPGEHEARVYEMGGRHQAWDRLPGITIPVTVVRGRVDPGPAVFAGDIAERLPAGRLEPHDELGHFGPLEDPDAMAASVQAVLDSLP